MKTAPFWQVFCRDNPITDSNAPIYSVKALRERINVLLDSDLYELLQNRYCRKELSEVLLKLI